MRRLYVGTIGIMMAAAMALSGCGPTASTESNTGTGTQAAGGQAQDGEKIKLVYWSNQRHDMEYVQQKIDEFNATNDMNIEVSYEAMTENYDNNLELSFQSNQAPDIFRAKSEITPYIKKDMIIPLDEYLTDEDREKYGDTLGVQNINDSNLKERGDEMDGWTEKEPASRQSFFS